MVVHGVGDPQPGETLSVFARSLAHMERPLLERQEVVWLGEKAEESDHVETFPAHKRQVQYGDQQIELCEAFWGDLSRVRRGWFGVVQGILQIVFGLRYVAYVAADQPGRAADWLKRLGLISSRILHGPVLAVTFYLVILMMAVCGTQILWPKSYQAPIWTQVVLAVCSMFAMAAAGIGHRITRSRVIERFWFWVNVTTMFVTGLMFLKSLWLDGLYPESAHECPIHPGLLWYCRVLLVLLGLLWFIEIQVMLAMACCWAWGLRHPRAHRPALHVAFLVPALAVGIWGQVLPMLWVSAKEGITILAKLDEFSSVFDDAIPFLGVQLMMMAVVLAAAGVVLARYYRWRRHASIETFEAGSRAPRLIVNNLLQVILAICTAVGVILVSILGIFQAFGNTGNDFWVRELMIKVNSYAVGVLIPMSGLLVFMIPRLRPAFDMLLDVVNHFYFRPTNVQDALDDDDEFDIAESTFENGALFFSRRDALHYRIKRILAHYRDEFDNHPELVIVSHSQGTMVAVEALNNEDLAWLNNSFRSVTLVTMGSPLGHLYQHYFGHRYPSLDQPFWASLRRRVDRWVNICRIDDFVGTKIDFPDDGLNETAGDSRDNPTERNSFYSPIIYSNHPVGPRGHQSYWTDREVLKLLREHLLENRTATRHRADAA